MARHCAFLLAAFLWIASLSDLSAGTLQSETEPLDFSALSEEQKQQQTKDGVLQIGDMLFKVRDLKARATLRRLWPNGRIIYAFGPEVTAGERNNFILACNGWSTDTSLQCIQRTSEPNYIIVRTHSGNECGGPWISCSFVGMQGGAQPLWIYNVHWNYLDVIQHELGHAIGLVHEHQRNDRDRYVYVNEQNFEPGSHSQFIKVGGAAYTEYDFNSIMHYDNCTFSKHAGCVVGKTPDFYTLLAKPCHIDLVGGNVISPLDKDGIRNAYAPSLQALLRRDRRSSCGEIEYEPSVLQEVCPSCAKVIATQFRKIETPNPTWCGMMPVVYPESYCVPLNKTYIRHWWDHDRFSCGRFNTETLNELWIDCGCPFQPIAATCTDINSFVDDSSDQNKDTPTDWRASRVIYFRDIVAELSNKGLLASDVPPLLGAFYQLNYLDPKFETKLAKMRAGVFSYARWKASLQPGYQLDASMFRKIAKYRRLRVTPDAVATAGN